MKKTIYCLIAAMLTANTLIGCIDTDNNRITGSGDIETVKKSFTDFDGIELSHACKATIAQADTYHIEIRIDDNIVEYLDVRKDGDTFSISLEQGRSYQNIIFEADITLPDLKVLRRSGASRLFYYGNPVLGDISKSGSSMIEKKD